MKLIDADKLTEVIMRVKLNSKGAPNFATAKEVQTKQVKYYDEDENVWKIGEVIIDEIDRR